MVQDEGRFGRVNIPRASWAPKGIRPNVGKQVIRQSFYVYSAVAVKEGEIISLILPYGNTEMMNIFLKTVSESYPNKEIIMQIDGAGWHRSKDLKIPANIHFIQQPPYSPEVNPTEHIWEELREKYLHNLVFNSLEDTMNKVEKGLKDLALKPDYVRSMTFFPHLNVSL